MPFELITVPPPSKVFRHLRRKLTQLIGVILLLTGLAASSLPLLLVVVLIVSMLSPNADFPDMDSEQAVLFLSATLIAIIGLALGLRLIRGRRRLVLFLRRFGYDEATAALSFAATSAMGQRWRLATLDDNEIAPILGIKGRGRLLGLMRWIALGAVVFGLFWLFGGGLADYISGIADNSHDRGGDFKEVVGQIIGNVIMMLLVGMIVGGVVLMLVAFLGATALFSWRSFRTYKKAELGQTKSIGDASQVKPVIGEVLKLSRKILAPRLVVVRVDSGIWKKVVKQFADVSAVILIDVSIPGKGLLWELEALKKEYQQRVILVGQYNALDALSAQPVENGNDDDIGHQLTRLLDGESILTYLGDKPGELKRFTKLLKAKLNDLY